VDNTIVENISSDKELIRIAIRSKGKEFFMPPASGWTITINLKAFLTEGDWEQARRIQASGVLDDWLNEKDLYG